MRTGLVVGGLVGVIWGFRACTSESPLAGMNQRMTTAVRAAELVGPAQVDTPEKFAKILLLSFDDVGDSSQDPWGQPYVLWRVDGDRFAVISCGPDRTCKTVDDIVVYGSWSRRAYADDVELPGWPRTDKVSSGPLLGPLAWRVIGGLGLLGLVTLGMRLQAARKELARKRKEQAPAGEPEPVRPARPVAPGVAPLEVAATRATAPPCEPPPCEPPPPPEPAPIGSAAPAETQADAPQGELDPPMVDLGFDDPPAEAQPAEAQPAETPEPETAPRADRPMPSGSYSIQRGRREASSPLVDDLQARPRAAAPRPADPRKPAPRPAAQERPAKPAPAGIVERVRGGAVATDTQRVQAQLERSRDRRRDEE